MVPRSLCFTLAVALCAVALQAPSAGAASGCTQVAAWPAARTDVGVRVVRLLNAHRAQMGLAPLGISPTLTAAATWKARRMAALNVMAHSDPGWRSPGDRFTACGYSGRRMWAENLAMGYPTAAAVVAAWLASPGHRANIERPGLRAAGVALASDYWALELAASADAGSIVPAAGTRVHVSCTRNGRVTCQVR